jgi:ABC-type polysaccharide/polyol phosphate transport system ATPase subunit
MSKTMIELKGVRKTFLLSKSGIASIKTLLLWWKRREIAKLEVLKGVDLSVRQGECVAVIGKNGAGKSTLLSLLARIYRPSEGDVAIHGRVAPLLELGAGFHPDLSGLENIYFNGVILGLTRAQIQERLPQIVEFSELGDHIGAPVRTYSSGMQARLGFSVAVHVDAEILIVDEVLAVGDYNFERKCFAKIDEFRKRGGTILVVSHQLDLVKKIADRVVWLRDGVVMMDGAPDEVVGAYLAEDRVNH